MAAAMASVARPMSETRLTARCTIYCDWLVSLIIATGVVFAWRGAWNICDSLLLPQQPLWSAAARLIGGSVLFVVACVIQPSLAAWARHHDRTRCLWLVDALYTYLSFWVSVLTWNGVWYIYDQVVGIGLAPAPPDWAHARQGAISHALGLLLLGSLGALRNSVAAPMVISSDAVAPIFGAGVTAGVGTWLNPFERLKRPPAVQSRGDWHRAVGVPVL